MARVLDVGKTEYWGAVPPHIVARCPDCGARLITDGGEPAVHRYVPFRRDPSAEAKGWNIFCPVCGCPSVFVLKPGEDETWARAPRLVGSRGYDVIDRDCEGCGGPFGHSDQQSALLAKDAEAADWAGYVHDGHGCFKQWAIKVLGVGADQISINGNRNSVTADLKVHQPAPA